MICTVSKSFVVVCSYLVLLEKIIHIGSSQIDANWRKSTLQKLMIGPLIYFVYINLYFILFVPQSVQKYKVAKR